MSYWESPGKSDNWYTPEIVFKALAIKFDLDVAGKNIPTSKVPADCVIEANSLSLPWNGFIWMNPPFGGRNGIMPWLKKFINHGNGIALTPDRTSAPWFQELARQSDMLLFTKKLRFLRTDGSEGKSPSNGTTLWAIGEKAVNALIHAQTQKLGITFKPNR